MDSPAKQEQQPDEEDSRLPDVMWTVESSSLVDEPPAPFPRPTLMPRATALSEDVPMLRIAIEI